MTTARSAQAIHATRPHDTARPWYDYAAKLLPTKPGRWIDLGCGQGELLARADVPKGGLGLDRDRTALKAGTGARFVVADLAQPLPFADDSFDGVSLVEVIEHLPDAEALVREIGRILRPGGWLVLTTPNVAHLTYRIRALTGHPPKQEGYHFRFFTKRTLSACLEAAGFRTEARASYGKQALLTKLARLSGRNPKRGPASKVLYQVPDPAESLLARHFVWRLRRSEREGGEAPRRVFPGSA